MTTPARIQRKRTKGWKRPLSAVIVDRTSHYGNPFREADAIEAEYSHPRLACVMNFRAWIGGSQDYPDVYEAGDKTYDRRRVLADLPKLRGMDLACPCPLPAEGEPDHCHAAVLLELAANLATQETSQ